MSAFAFDGRFAHLVDWDKIETLDVMGPTIQFLAGPEDDGPCIMRGTIPPGTVVPLHSHPEPETFFSLAGRVEGLAQDGENLKWLEVNPGDVFHVPSGAKHAWRNLSAEPSVALVITSPTLGRFFKEVGAPIVPGVSRPGPPSGEAIRNFLEIADRYGYWNAGPEENDAIGLSLPAP